MVLPTLRWRCKALGWLEEGGDNDNQESNEEKAEEGYPVLPTNSCARSIDSFFRHHVLRLAVLGESHSPILLNYYGCFRVEFSSLFVSFFLDILLNLSCMLYMWWFHNICYHWVKEWLQRYSKMGCLVSEYGYHGLRISWYTFSFLILKKSGLVENGAVQDLYVRYGSNLGRFTMYLAVWYKIPMW
jgi:hypothetical protein